LITVDNSYQTLVIITSQSEKKLINKAKQRCDASSRGENKKIRKNDRLQTTKFVYNAWLVIFLLELGKDRVSLIIDYFVPDGFIISSPSTNS
jgi:hypothetical protein